MEKYLRVKQEMVAARKEIEKEKAAWLAVRNKLSAKQATGLDKQFNAGFLKMNTFFQPCTTILTDVLETLRPLVQQGAAASLLGDDELGSYNLAMLIKEIASITDKTQLDLTIEIIRLTIVAGANLKTQKAYIGNGGAIGLEWILIYLAGGIGEGKDLQNLDQYACCYKIFSWIINEPTPAGFNPFNVYLVLLKNSPEVADIQEDLILAMIGHGCTPFIEDDYYNAAFFGRIAARQPNWLNLLFPYEQEALTLYINTTQLYLTKEIVNNLLNAFTGNNKTRKHFNAFFLVRPHWLLRYIIGSAPEIIFGLVKRNEQDMLKPFLKHFKPALIALKDEQGNTLLHAAILSRSLNEHTIQLLRNNGFSLQAVNKEGLTPLQLAMKNNKPGLAKLLK
jgi:hypothetical protein